MVVDISTVTPESSTMKKSTRVHIPHFQLQDSMSVNAINAHWWNMARYPSLPLSHKAMKVQHSSLVEPTSHSKAAQNPKWIKAIEVELKALEANHTCELVSIPPWNKEGKKLQSVKSVFTSNLGQIAQLRGSKVG